jgi:hypothetical protein
MSESPQSEKPAEFTLPAGFMVKIGDLPYSLKTAVVVEGFREPRWHTASGIGDEDCQG